MHERRERDGGKRGKTLKPLNDQLIPHCHLPYGSIKDPQKRTKGELPGDGGHVPGFFSQKQSYDTHVCNTLRNIAPKQSGSVS